MTDKPSQDFEVRRQLVQLQMLYEVGLALGESLDPAHVAQEILQRALVMVDARAGALLVRAADGATVVAGQVGLDAAAPDLAARVEDAWEYTAPVQADGFEGTGAHLCLVPLRSHGEVHGLLVVVDKEARDGTTPFTEADLALLDSFALQAGAALRNARLHLDLQAAYDALQAAQARIAQLEQLRALGALAGEITHALRHVLGLVVGNADAWLTLGGDPETAMSAILTAAEGGQSLIDRIHRFTRLGVGRERTQEDVDEIVADAVGRSRELAGAGSRVDWQIELAGDLPRTWLNREDIGEAALNLLENAVHASGDGGHVRVATALVDGGVEFRVEDDGPGIPDDALERIFEPFYSTRGGAGTGLGLSIVYRIVEDHDGAVDVLTDPGRGSTFTVRLPVIDQPPVMAAETEVLADDGEEDPHRR